MIWVFGWFVGSFVSWLCFLKVSKSVLGQQSFDCGDLAFYALLSVLSGPMGIGASGIICLIEHISSRKYSSGKCKKLVEWVSKNI